MIDLLATEQRVLLKCEGRASLRDGIEDRGRAPGARLRTPPMTRSANKPPATEDEHPIEAQLRKTHSIGQLELMAGIGPDPDERFAFWIRFKALEAKQIIPAGVFELRHRIKVRNGLV
ncbi:MAG: hypothetical protein ABW003_09765 [Microvirga sp.]